MTTREFGNRIQYKLHLDPSQAELPSGCSLEDYYCSYTVDADGALVGMSDHSVMCFTSENGDTQRTEQYMNIKLMD